MSLPAPALPQPKSDPCTVSVRASAPDCLPAAGPAPLAPTAVVVDNPLAPLLTDPLPGLLVFVTTVPPAPPLVNVPPRPPPNLRRYVLVTVSLIDVILPSRPALITKFELVIVPWPEYNPAKVLPPRPPSPTQISYKRPGTTL